MSAFRVEIRVVPRRGILDPQGKAVADALHSLGFADVTDVSLLILSLLQGITITAWLRLR